MDTRGWSELTQKLSLRQFVIKVKDPGVDKVLSQRAISWFGVSLNLAYPFVFSLSEANTVYVWGSFRNKAWMKYERV